MKQLLTQIHAYTWDVICRDFKSGDRDQDELSHGEVRHAVRKLKQLTDSDYDALRKEASKFDEGGDADNLDGHSSESSATEEYRGHRGVLDIEWPDDLIATVSHFRKSTLSLIKPRFYSKKHRGFQPKSRAAQTAWEGKQTLRPSVEVPRTATSWNKHGLSLHSARMSTGQFFNERKGTRTSTGEREYSPPQSPLRSKASSQSGPRGSAPKPSARS
jgi:hypothetical protein